MNMDYYDIAQKIADTIGKGAEPFTADQRAMLTAAMAPWLMQRDERVAELEKHIEGCNKTIALFLGPDGEKYVDKFEAAVKSLL